MATTTTVTAKEIVPMTIRDYRLYVLEGSWKCMEPTRMSYIFSKMLKANWLSHEQKERVQSLIEQLHAKTHKAVSR